MAGQRDLNTQDGYSPTGSASGPQGDAGIGSTPGAVRQDQYTNFGLATSQVDPRTGMAGQFDFGRPGSRNHTPGAMPNSGGGGGLGSPFIPFTGQGLGMNNGGGFNPFAGVGFNQNSYGLAPYLNNIRMQLIANGYYLPWLRNGGGGQ